MRGWVSRGSLRVDVRAPRIADLATYRGGLAGELWSKSCGPLPIAAALGGIDGDGGTGTAAAGPGGQPGYDGSPGPAGADGQPGS